MQILQLIHEKRPEFNVHVSQGSQIDEEPMEHEEDHPGDDGDDESMGAPVDEHELFMGDMNEPYWGNCLVSCT